MSASPNNAGLQLVNQELTDTDLNNDGLIKDDLVNQDSINKEAVPNSHSTAGLFRQEALQALLAFSSLHQQIRQRRLREQRAGRSLTREDDWQLEQFVLDEVLQLVAERALATTGADGVALALAENNAIICRASAGSIAPDAGMRLDPNSGFSGECLISGRIVRCDDVDTDPRVNLEACHRLGVRSLVAVPLSAKHNVIGLLEAFSTEPYGFNDSDVRTLNLLAELILSAMRPEEEDRLAEISQRVVQQATVTPELPSAVELEILKLSETVTASSSQPEISEETPKEIPQSPEKAPKEIIVSQTISKPLSIPQTSSKPISDEAFEPIIEPLVVAEYGALNNSSPGLAVVVAVVLFAIGLGGGLWWTLGHRPHQAITAVRSQISSSRTQPATSDIPASTPPPAPASLTDDGIDSSPALAEESGVLPQVTSIRHWSAVDSSTVVIDIQDQVQYEAHRLPNPERIYFDLHDTKLASDLANRIISVDDALLQRVRVAQPMPGVTRVVLETRSASDFSVSLEPNPYRLVVEVRKLGNKSRAREKVDLFAPADSAPAVQVAVNQTPPTQPSPAPVHDKSSAASAMPSNPAEKPAPISTPKLVVVLDAGHGGWDLGTVGRKGLLEKDLVLDIVERTGSLIENRLGAKVIYTRQDDIYLPLEKRAEIANVAQAQLFISVHANYSDFPSARGVETYYSNTYSSVKARTEEADDVTSLQNINWTNVDIREKVHESRRIAASVQHSLYAILAAKTPGLPNRGVKEAHYVVLTGTSMPAILAEVSFVSSPTDENNLQSSTYRQQIAEALYNGIARYEASNHPVKIASASAKLIGR
jgi:N-acetylmuramoyl-L-alanine amidase